MKARYRPLLKTFNLNQLVARCFLGIITFYQTFISPILPARCRFYPTCSQYGQQAIRWHGAWEGGFLTVKRICRCHPLGGHGVDFVPLPLSKWTYHPVVSKPLKKNESVNLVSNVPHGTYCLSDATDVPRGTNHGLKKFSNFETVYLESNSYRVMLNQLLKQ